MPEWTLLPFAVLRMAGFPFDYMDLLKTREVTALSDEVRRAEADRRRAAQARRENVPGATAADEAARAVDDATAAYQTALSHSVDTVSRGLHSAFRADELLRAALMLSNESAWLRLGPWLDGQLPDALTKQDRRNAETLALYLQRLATRNDTASHYGPFSPVAFTGDQSRADVTNVRRRLPLLSRWATHEIIDSLQQDLGLRPHLEVRVSPAYIEDANGCRLLEFDHRRRAPKLGEVLRCELLYLSQHARVLIQQVLETPFVAAKDVERLATDGGVDMDELGGLYEVGVLGLGPFVAYGDGDPLPTMLKALPGDHESHRLLRDCVEAVARFGDRDAADDWELLQAVNEAVRRLSPEISERKQSATFYSDRSFVHEECIGPIQHLQLSSAVHRSLEQLGQPLLDLFMLRPRVRHAALRVAMSEWFDNTFENDTVPISDFAHACLSDTAAMKAISGTVARISHDLDQTVQQALGVDPHAANHELDLNSLSELVRRLDRNEPAICNPDIMVHATSLAEMDAGNFQIVVGDLHADEDNLTHSLFGPYMTAHFEDLPTTVRCAYESLLSPNEALLDVTLYHRNKTFLRQSIGLRDLELQDYSPTPHHRARLADLHVRRSDGDLRLCLAGESTSQRLVALPLAWTGVGFNPFEVFGFPQRDGAPILPLGDLPHLPRISAGRCVLQRETWALSPKEIPHGSLATVVLESQRLRVRRQLPTRLFVKSVNEPKPVFIDFDSPLLLKQLALIAKKSDDNLIAQELFPDDNGLWNQAAGSPVTSELRCTAVSGAAPAGVS